jgi:heat shock protein HslJ
VTARERIVRASMVVLCGLLAACASMRPQDKPEEVTPPPPPPPNFRVGAFAYMADAASFVDCATGKRYPVVMERDYLALENAYTNAPHEPGADVIVTLEGHIETRPFMEGRPREQLLVDRFDAIWPEESCEKAGVKTTLGNTYWRLVDFQGKPIAARPGQREMHILIPSDQKSVRGYAGCDFFAGDCKVDGRSITFRKLAASENSCPGKDTETRFIAALERVVSWRVLGETLVLADEKGPVARFRAVYF